MQQDKINQPKDTFPTRRQTLIILSLLTLPYAIGLIVTAFFAFASPLILVSGPAEYPLVAWGEAILFCTSPLIFIIGIVGSWFSFTQQRYRLALTLASMPIVETILLIIGSVFADNLL